MKQIIKVLILFLITATLCSCSKLEISGIENYSPNTCNVGLTYCLFPDEAFLQMYEYDKSLYRYEDDIDLVRGSRCTAFAALSYPPEIYQEAKQFCLSEFELSEVHQYVYEGFQFAEHYCHKIRDDTGKLVIGCDFPRHFNMFAYNDETCELLFLGYYNGDSDSTERQLAETDFAAFLEEVYSDTYSFDK